MITAVGRNCCRIRLIVEKIEWKNKRIEFSFDGLKIN